MMEEESAEVSVGNEELHGNGGDPEHHRGEGQTHVQTADAGGLGGGA
jgi:hypothetical protein